MMRRLVVLALLLAPRPLGAPTAPRPEVEAYFAPGPAPAAAIVAAVDGARSEVRVLAYAFTSGPIADALVRAKGRGVDVAVVVDAKEAVARGNRVPDMLGAGIPAMADGKHPIMHDKCVTVDGAVVLTGSFNFSRQASSNAENLIVIHDAATAGKYLRDWAFHAGHSGPAPARP